MPLQSRLNSEAGAAIQGCMSARKTYEVGHISRGLQNFVSFVQASAIIQPLQEPLPQVN